MVVVRVAARSHNQGRHRLVEPLHILGKRDELGFSDHWDSDSAAGPSASRQFTKSSSGEKRLTPAIRKKAKLALQNPTKRTPPVVTEPAPSSSSLDVLGSILAEQSLLQLKSADVRITRDGSIKPTSLSAVKLQSRASRVSEKARTARTLDKSSSSSSATGDERVGAARPERVGVATSPTRPERVEQKTVGDDDVCTPLLKELIYDPRRNVPRRARTELVYAMMRGDGDSDAGDAPVKSGCCAQGNGAAGNAVISPQEGATSAPTNCASGDSATATAAAALDECGFEAVSEAESMDFGGGDDGDDRSGSGGDGDGARGDASEHGSDAEGANESNGDDDAANGNEEDGAEDGEVEEGGAVEDGEAEEGGAEDGEAEEDGAEDGEVEDGEAEEGGAEDGVVEGGAEDGEVKDGQATPAAGEEEEDEREEDREGDEEEPAEEEREEGEAASEGEADEDDDEVEDGEVADDNEADPVSEESEDAAHENGQEEDDEEEEEEDDEEEEEVTRAQEEGGADDEQNESNTAEDGEEACEMQEEEANEDGDEDEANEHEEGEEQDEEEEEEAAEGNDDDQADEEANESHDDGDGDGSHGDDAAREPASSGEEDAVADGNATNSDDAGHSSRGRSPSVVGSVGDNQGAPASDAESSGNSVCLVDIEQLIEVIDIEAGVAKVERVTLKSRHLKQRPNCRPRRRRRQQQVGTLSYVTDLV
ncbi:PREDICTED: spore wall protein 2-like [Priapulus caudatus]|uniref:Spore wall protein 2-like n=1 Tax=Priapulus caudatus TaxID=37621 RepID=A0ABM1EAN1_PRICU|nr:PREDICTED: spore wall protein 2-like [Priapulus caudatus]